MSEFELAQCRTEYDNAIRSLVAASKTAALAQQQRDEVVAVLAKVVSLIDKWDIEGMPAFPTGEIRYTIEGKS